MTLVATVLRLLTRCSFYVNIYYPLYAIYRTTLIMDSLCEILNRLYCIRDNELDNKGYSPIIYSRLNLIGTFEEERF